MTRDKAINNLSVAFGECRDKIRRLAEAVGQLSEDVEKIKNAYAESRVLAKSLSRHKRKSYVSPYAKFDKLRKKRK